MPKKKRKTKLKKSRSLKKKKKSKNKKKTSRKKKYLKRKSINKKKSIIKKNKSNKNTDTSEETVFKPRLEWIKASLANKAQYQNKYNESIKNNNTFWKKEGLGLNLKKKLKMLNIVNKR